MSNEDIQARHRRCPSECRPVAASVISERDLGHQFVRKMHCHRCGVRWTQHRYV